MTQEPDQLPAPKAGPAAAAGSARTASKTAGSKQAPRPRAGVPVWRTGKPDAVLAAAVDLARSAVETIAPAEQIGGHIGARSEGDRLVTHLFESRLPGYLGWQWYAVLTRNSRSKTVTVDELGLLPSEDSILAPAWVPWAERVRPEDAQADEPLDDEASAEDETDDASAEDETAGTSGQDTTGDDTTGKAPTGKPERSADEAD
ncbi:DUF3027 domain-containing protein [Arthrobacter sp. PM3]|uniref:DUF3027 domain-containing protein n=1 Tax=Arthrobacter sp. PM3 TaxID=2017685 RepID=UPI000E10996F|nr:DUF3027 domain-containing protein [Arthrobacter sp. PM3]AXJ10063.1 hypothetical protein CFN17_10820 [Arthrobacter sp. PM3]